MREYVRGGGNQFGEKNITEALEGSLRRLKTDCIDLYQLHWPERKTNFFGKLGYEHDDSGEWNQFEDVLGNLQKFVDAGKIREVGLSNETPWGVSKYLELSKEKGLPRMMSIQNPYNLLNRTYEVGLAEVFGRILRCQALVNAAKLNAIVSDQGARQQTRLAQNLKTVAYAEDGTALFGKGLQVLHDRGKPGDSSATQVIAEGNPPGTITASVSTGSADLCQTRSAGRPITSFIACHASQSQLEPGN